MRKKVVGSRLGFRLSRTWGDRPARAPCLGPSGWRREVALEPQPGSWVEVGVGGRCFPRKVSAQSCVEMERDKAGRHPWGLSAKGLVTLGGALSKALGEGGWIRGWQATDGGGRGWRESFRNPERLLTVPGAER